VSTKECTPDSKLLRLSIPKHLVPPPDTPGLRPVWSVFIKDDDIQVERPYTPLEGIDESGDMLFWIKKYPKGEVGRWLHSKSAGDTVELRGPLMSWNWQADVWDEVVLVSIGALSLQSIISE
jgi:cytochrome-b5 reductase